MKKEYTAPEFETVLLRLSADVLGDSKPEFTDKPIYNDPTDGGDLDPFT